MTFFRSLRHYPPQPVPSTPLHVRVVDVPPQPEAAPSSPPRSGPSPRQFGDTPLDARCDPCGAKGFTRPLRLSYRHTGLAGPQHPLRDLTAEEQECYAGNGYVRYEEYPADALPALGRFWTQAQLDAIGNGCGSVTTMNRAIAETYSASPGFYGATFCVGCRMHLPVGASGEFTWLDEHGNDTHIRVGT